MSSLIDRLSWEKEQAGASGEGRNADPNRKQAGVYVDPGLACLTLAGLLAALLSPNRGRRNKGERAAAFFTQSLRRDLTTLLQGSGAGTFLTHGFA